MNQIQQELNAIPTKIFKNAQWISKSLSVNKRKSPNYPCKRWGHTAVLHDKYMYVFSGCGKSDNPRQWEQIYRMDCITFQWERLNSPSQKHPTGRDSHCCVCLQNKLYIFGGSSNELILDDFWSFDIESSEWSEIEVPKDMEGREGHSMVALSQRLIYIYGGWDQVQNIMTESHWLYDIKTNKFQQVTHFTGDEMIKLESHTANKIGDSVYIFGGQGQQSNKQLVFHKDLYKLDFENINELHAKFDQLLQQGEDKGENIENDTVIRIEKIKANGSQQPTPRASHSAVAYGDRFLFIIGGEGYQYDQQKDNEEVVIEQNQDDNQNIDEEEKPIFPKNDIWIFETVMRTWSKLQPKSKNPIFQPRFSHSCIVYKDQFIIFGGLRSMGEVLEDIMVLHLKDSENNILKYARDEMKNVCKYCQLIYGIQQEEEISYHKTNENNAIKLPKLSLTFVDEISKLIQCPMSCFGLFLDNVKLSEASEINFEYVFLQRKKKYQNTVDEIRDKIPVLILFEKDPKELEDLNDFLFNFDISKRKWTTENQNIDLKNESEQNQVLEEQQLLNRKQYAMNFKIASLRLGDSVLICHKSSNNYYVGLISMNNQLNPNDETLTFYNYTITISNGTERKLDSPESKYVLLNAITHLINEEDFILNCNYNYTKIFIFDLVRIHTQLKIFELSLFNDDIISNQSLAYGLKKDDAIKYPDFSLKEYLKYYSLESLPFKVSVQNQYINMNNNVLSRIENKNKVSVSNEKIVNQLSEWTESYELSILTQNNFGILLYYQGRLINRYRKQLGVYPGNLDQSGYINIQKIIKPNMTFEGFKNSYLRCILLQTLEELEEECEPERRKEIKI